jgi:hypothetical protein
MTKPIKQRLVAWLLLAVVLVLLGVSTNLSVAGSVALIGLYAIEAVMIWRYKKQYPRP